VSPPPAPHPANSTVLRTAVPTDRRDRTHVMASSPRSCDECELLELEAVPTTGYGTATRGTTRPRAPAIPSPSDHDPHAWTRASSARIPTSRSPSGASQQLSSIANKDFLSRCKPRAQITGNGCPRRGRVVPRRTDPSASRERTPMGESAASYRLSNARRLETHG
jgi:hypothetical protein